MMEKPGSVDCAAHVTARKNNATAMKQQGPKCAIVHVRKRRKNEMARYIGETLIVSNHIVPRSSQNQFTKETNFICCFRPQLLTKAFSLSQLVQTKLKNLQRKGILKDHSARIPSLYVNRMCSRSKRDGSIQRTGVHGEFGDVINVNSNGCDGM